MFYLSINFKLSIVCDSRFDVSLKTTYKWVAVIDTSMEYRKDINEIWRVLLKLFVNLIISELRVWNIFTKKEQ